MDHADVLQRDAEGPDATLRYADHPDGIVEVFLPASLGTPATPHPLAIAVHGGFWRQEFDRVHLRPLAGALTRAGWVVALPEYRRTGPGGGGGWPATGDDVATALRVVPGELGAVAPGWTDPAAPAVVLGHSAGGHLALWAGLRQSADHVARVVALAPVTDLRRAAEDRLDDGAAQLLLGGEPHEVPEAYDAADPFSGLAVHGTAGSRHPAVTIIHGSADLQVPAAMSRAAATRHPRVHHVELDGVEHFALIDPLSEAFTAAVLPALGG